MTLARRGWPRLRAWLDGERGAAGPGAGRGLVDAALLQKLDRLSLAVGPDLISGLMGAHQARRRTSGIEFADYRPYSTGDDPRRVDWQAYARLGVLHVRQAQAEHDTALYLLVDASPSMDYGAPAKFLVARRLAAALGYIALTGLDSLVVGAPGARPAAVGPLRGRAASALLFGYLDALGIGRPVPFDDLLARWSAAPGQGRLAILISDLLLDGYQAGVQRLIAAGCRVLLLHLLSPEELRPTASGDVELVDNETGQPLALHLGGEALAEYGRRHAAWLAETHAWCRSQGAGYVLVDSGWDVERVLLETLRRQGVTI